MTNIRDIIVTTTPSLEGIKILKYIKPISSHIVAGTDLFSDFFASLSDIFGGRSKSYQKQLKNVYDEAIERLKYSAIENGANCIVGLRVDMDEISGKGKSMFMITAVGTAVVIDQALSIDKNATALIANSDIVSLDMIRILSTKRSIIEKAQNGTLQVNDETWEFIISNHMTEVFPFLLSKYKETMQYEPAISEPSSTFYNKLINFIDLLPEDSKLDTIYNAIEIESHYNLVIRLCNIINELNLLDIQRIPKMLESSDFDRKKIGLRLLTSDKSAYNIKDKNDLEEILLIIQKQFPEKGLRSLKKQILSSKETEVWTCECGKKNNEIGKPCAMCQKDIYGFNSTDPNPDVVTHFIKEKIELINTLIG